MEKKMDLFKENAVVRIRKGAGRSLKAGGAWIYDNEIEAIQGEFENGGLVRVEDFDGYCLGHGFINTRSKPVSYTHLSSTAPPAGHAAFSGTSASGPTRCW